MVEIAFTFARSAFDARLKTADLNFLKSRGYACIPAEIRGSKSEIKDFLWDMKCQNFRFTSDSAKVYALLKPNPNFERNFARGSLRGGTILGSIVKGIVSLYRMVNPNLKICLFDSDKAASPWREFSKHEADFSTSSVSVADLKSAFASKL